MTSAVSLAQREAVQVEQEVRADIAARLTRLSTATRSKSASRAERRQGRLLSVTQQLAPSDAVTESEAATGAADELEDEDDEEEERWLEDGEEEEEELSGGWHAALSVPASASTAASASPSLLSVGVSALRANLLPALVLQGCAVLLLLLYYSSPAVAAAFAQVAAVKEQYGFLYSALSAAVAGGLIPAAFIAIRERRGHQRLRAAGQPGQSAADSDSSSGDAEAEQSHAEGALSPSRCPSVPVRVPSIEWEAVFLTVLWAEKGSASPSSRSLPAAARRVCLTLSVLACGVCCSAVSVEVDAFYSLQGLVFGQANGAAQVVPKVLVDMFVYNPVSCTAA